LRRPAGATAVDSKIVMRVLDEHRQLVARRVELERLLDRLLEPWGGLRTALRELANQTG
jgi:hypothetical protein